MFLGGAPGVGGDVRLGVRRLHHVVGEHVILDLLTGNVGQHHAVDLDTGGERLAGLANAYREEEGKEPVTADPMLRALARAHAADMMLNDFMGHKASTGHDFASRVTAYVGDASRFPSIGENAARDTQKTPVDTKKARVLFA